MQSYSSKLKIIFLALAVLSFSGCAKNAGLIEKKSIIPENPAPIWTSDVQKKPIKILFVGGYDV